jgi:predicted NACHT family NTPase
MVEPWTALGVSILKDLVLKEILLKLGKEALEDYVKDFFKDCIKEGVQLAQPDVLKKALGEALQQFLKLIEDELLLDFTEAEVRDNYQVAIARFIRDDEVKPLLGKAFEKDCRAIEADKLRAIWGQRDSPAMPVGFNWEEVAKQYVKEVKRIVRNAPELRAILELEIQESLERQLRENAGIAPDFNLAKYQEGLLECYGNLKLDSVDTSGCAYNELKLWKLFIPQNVRQVHELVPQVYEIPKEHQRRLRESNQLDAEVSLEELQRYKEVYSQQPIRPIREIIKDKDNYRYLVILGDPGSGKSTLLQYLALDWANSTLKDASLQPIPLLIELRTYMRNRDSGQCKNFLGFFHDSSGVICNLNQHQLVEQLKAGNALVMFDGLDEVFDLGKREDVITDIHRFTNDYPNVRVIVTSRVIGYKPPRLRDAQFHHFMLQDLDEKQIKDFVNRWHNLTFNDEADKVRKRERLQRAIETSKAIGELAGNPLLLTMMAILNRNQELPRDRPELYNQASRVLLHQWDVERALVEHQQLEIQTLDYKDKQAMLRQVAYHMQAAEKGLAGNLISANELERILTEYLKTIETNNPRAVARVMIKQLRERNFILCFLGADCYAFVHRTFLEYFCAWEFVWQFEKERTLSLEELKTEVFGKHWWDESWHEVLRLIVGMIEVKLAGEIIEYLTNQQGEEQKFINLFLAAECLSEVRNRSLIAPTATQLLNQVKGLTKYDLPYYYKPYGKEADLVREIRTKAVATVATNWKDDPDTLPLLKELAQMNNDWIVRQVTVQALARVFTDDLHTLAILKHRAQTDDDRNVRGAAVQEIARGWKDDPDILPWLKSLALSDQDGYVRAGVVEEISRRWRNDPETLPWLKSIALSDDNKPPVRPAAVRVLAKGWRNDPEILPLLKTLIQSNGGYGGVRRAALQEWVQGWRDDPEILPLLKTLALSDDEDIRSTAIEEWAKGWRDDPEILPLLKTLALSDGNWAVRCAVLRELANGWKDDPDTLTIIKQKTQTDDNEHVRYTAVQALAQGWKDDPDTLPLLKQKAQSDDNDAVRYVAVQELAQGWKDDPDTLPLLKQKAQSDDHEYVRYAAVQKLALGWKDEPWMFELLCNCAINDPFVREKDWQDNPRQLALEVIIKQYPDYPQTLPLLRDRAENDPDEKVKEFAQKKLAELEK